MTQPDGYRPRKYESEVYVEVAGANADKNPWLNPDWQDPAEIAGEYSNKSAEMYEQRLAAAGGGYRPGLESSDVDYRAMPHAHLQAMVHDGASAEDVDEQGQVVNDLGNLFKELTGTIRQAVSKEQSGWQGHGAEAAFQGLGALSNWLDSSGDAAFLTANRYSQTSAAIANAQHAMPEPAGQTVLQSLDQVQQQLSSGDLLGAIQTYKNVQAQSNAAFQAQQQAAAVLTARDQTFHATGTTQPIYAPPPQPAAPTPAPVSPPSGPVTGPNTVIPDPGRTTAASAFTPSAPPVAAPGTSGGGGSSVPSPGYPVPGGTSTGSSPVGGIPVSGPAVGGWNRLPGSTLNPGLDVGLVSPVGGPGGGADIERGGSGRSGGGSGASSGRAAGRVPTGGTEQEPGAGKKSGTAEPGAKAATEAARSGTAGKTGKAGASGMPGAAGGKKGDEDKERKRPDYIVDDNPDDTYGINIETDEKGNKIAPPVIGG